MPRDIAKTLTYLCLHLTVGFTVAYLMTGSLALAGGIALIEPCINAVAFWFHERAWKRLDERTSDPHRPDSRGPTSHGDTPASPFAALHPA